MLKADTADIKALRFGEFDATPGLDVFRVTSTAWQISSRGSGPWTMNASSTIPAATLALGDFDGALDGRTDVIGVSPALTEDDANGW